MPIITKSNNIMSKIKSSLYSQYDAKACNEWRGPSSRLSAWATQLRRNVAAVASRWRNCADLTNPEFEPEISRTDTTELTASLSIVCISKNALYRNCTAQCTLTVGL